MKRLLFALPILLLLTTTGSAQQSTMNITIGTTETLVLNADQVNLLNQLSGSATVEVRLKGFLEQYVAALLALDADQIALLDQPSGSVIFGARLKGFAGHYVGALLVQALNERQVMACGTRWESLTESEQRDAIRTYFGGTNPCRTLSP